ncbi:hypothetical protein [Nitratireductor alexandrii]|nr:hypothetical protein [Nitratireductor alexandrii]
MNDFFLKAMDDEYCVAAHEEAIDRHGRPEIFNTDQEAQRGGAGF